jgi:hypothetical protein
MHKMIFTAAAMVALMATAPVSAQVYFSDDPAAGAGSDGAAVPAYGGNRVREFAGSRGSVMTCREVREQVVTPRGRVAGKLHRSCY